MATITYLGLDDVEVDCSVISGEEGEILEIMQNSDISFEDLCKAYFEMDFNEDERKELIRELQSIGGSSELTMYEVKDWIREQRDIKVLTDTLVTLTETLTRRAQILSEF